MSDRYFDNPYPDHAVNTSFQIREQFIKDLIQNYITKIHKHTSPKVHKINSRSRGDLYVGSSGIAFMFLKLSQSCMFDSFPALEMAKDYVDNAEEILNKTESKKLISLLSGNVGVHIVSSAVNKALNLPVDKDIKNILRGMSIFENPEYLDDSQDEMLVGRCGFVLGIQWLQKQLKTDIISQDDMKELAQVMLKSGREYARANEHSVPLMYQYHGREYLGAAHGVSAILLSLLNIPLKEGDLSHVKTTCDP